MKDAQHEPAAVVESKAACNKRSTPTRFQKKDLLKFHSTARVRPHIDKWVHVELNDRWEQLNKEFILWYYYLIKLLLDPVMVTDRLMNFLLAYKDKTLVDKFVNLVARQLVSIITPFKLSHPDLLTKD